MVWPFKKNQEELNDALVAAAAEGNLAGVIEALAHGGDLHAENESALRWAAWFGQLPVVKYLAERIFEPERWRGKDAGILAEAAKLAEEIWRHCGAERAELAVEVLRREALRTLDFFEDEKFRPLPRRIRSGRAGNSRR
jgi:hypothetical protein